MNLLQIVLAALLAAGIPVVFLVIIYTLDLYASRTFRLVLLCFAWGALGGLGLSYVFNTYVALPFIVRMGLSYVWLYVVFAPVAEELLKSAAVVYVSRRPEFTYFVDGAIYGFAAGIGFSITENFMYITFYPERGIILTLVRTFSVCLMHGTAAGLVGAVVGLFRFDERPVRMFALVGGWMAAILLHAMFNNVSRGGQIREGLVVPLQVGIGLAGIALIVFIILSGLRAQRAWLTQNLKRIGEEGRAVQAYGSPLFDRALALVARQFPRKAEQIESFVLHHAQIGIKRRILSHVDDRQLQTQLEREIAQLEGETERLRKDMGACAMTYVKCVFPDGASDIWPCLEKMLECETSAAGGGA